MIDDPLAHAVIQWGALAGGAFAIWKLWHAIKTSGQVDTETIKAELQWKADQEKAIALHANEIAHIKEESAGHKKRDELILKKIDTLTQGVSSMREDIAEIKGALSAHAPLAAG